MAKPEVNSWPLTSWKPCAAEVAARAAISSAQRIKEIEGIILKGRQAGNVDAGARERCPQYQTTDAAATIVRGLEKLPAGLFP